MSGFWTGVVVGAVGLAAAFGVVAAGFARALGEQDRRDAERADRHREAARKARSP